MNAFSESMKMHARREEERIMRSVVVETWERNNFVFNKYIHHFDRFYFITENIVTETAMLWVK